MLLSIWRSAGLRALGCHLRHSAALPDHSALTRIRQRWGSERFRAIFVRVVRDCQSTGIVSGDVVHMDATLIRADVSLGSLVAQHLDAVDLANLNEDDRLSRQTGKFKTLCVTDPDAVASGCAIGPSTTGDGDKLCRTAVSAFLQAAHLGR